MRNLVFEAMQQNKILMLGGTIINADYPICCLSNMLLILLLGGVVFLIDMIG